MSDDHDRRPAGPEIAEAAAGQDEGEIEILGIEALDDEGNPSRGGTEPPGEAAPAPGSDVRAGGAEEADDAGLQERYVRLLADFDNFRKRSEREREDRARYALMEPMRDLLPVLDNLERALSVPGVADDLRRGVEMVARQFLDVLRRYGVEPVAAIGEPFDPRVHDAVMKVESPDVSAATVVEELQRGYRLHERLLRPAMVRVAVPPEASPGGATGDGEA
jgi:molecular chaperone GrpE